MDFLIEDVHDQSYQIKKKIITTKMVPEERWTAVLSSSDSFDMEKLSLEFGFKAGA